MHNKTEAKPQETVLGKRKRAADVIQKKPPLVPPVNKDADNSAMVMDEDEQSASVDQPRVEGVFVSMAAADLVPGTVLENLGADTTGMGTPKRPPLQGMPNSAAYARSPESSRELIKPVPVVGSPLFGKPPLSVIIESPLDASGEQAKTPLTPKNLSGELNLVGGPSGVDTPSSLQEVAGDSPAPKEVSASSNPIPAATTAPKQLPPQGPTNASKKSVPKAVSVAKSSSGEAPKGPPATVSRRSRRSGSAGRN